MNTKSPKNLRDFHNDRSFEGKSVGVLNLGCARNLVDSQIILGHLKRNGHPIVSIEKSDVAIVILKTIALVNIFGREAGLLDVGVIDSYIKELYGKDSSELIAKLEQNKLIKFFRHRNKLNFIDGTDVDIQQELFNASKYIDHDIDLTVRLKSYFSYH